MAVAVLVGNRMTILIANIRDVAGIDDRTTFTFEIPIVRGSTTGGVVTSRQSSYRAADGVLTTDDLEPGPAVLRISGTPIDFHITIPADSDPVQLWPLIDAATPPDGTAWMTGFVRNAGGVARIQAVHVDEYPGLVKDPATFYVLYE